MIKSNVSTSSPSLRKEVLQQTVSEGHYIHGYMVNSGILVPSHGLA